MRKLISLSLVLFVFFSGCTISISRQSGCSDGKTETIIGNGVMITEVRDLSDFTAIRCRGIVQIEVVPGDRFSISLSGDENIVKLLRPRIDGDQLDFHLERENIQIGKGSINAIITIPTSLTRIEVLSMGHMTINSVVDTLNFKAKVSGMSNVIINDMKTQSFNLKVSGMGKVECTGTTENLTIENSGMGDVKLRDLVAKNVECDNSGMGKVLTVMYRAWARCHISEPPKV